VRLLGSFLAVLIANVPLQAGAITADDFRGYANWGPLRLTTQSDSLGIFGHHENLLLLKGKKTLMRIQGYYLVEKMQFVSLTKGHFKDLKVDVWDQVAQCCMDSVFMRIENGKPQVLFRYSARGYDVWFDGAEDLDGDGNKEIIAAADVLTFFDDMCMACRPPIYLVIGFDGKKWRDVTRRFPNEIVKVANGFKQDVLNLEKANDWDRQIPEVDTEIYSSAVGYLGNMMRVKDDYHADLSWLEDHLPRSMYSKLKKSSPDLLRRARSATSLVHER